MEEEIRRRFFPDKTFEERREAAPTPTKYTYRTDTQRTLERKPSFAERIRGGFGRVGANIKQNIKEKIEFEREKKRIYKEAYRKYSYDAMKVRAEREAYREALGSKERAGYDAMKVRAKHDRKHYNRMAISGYEREAYREALRSKERAGRNRIARGITRLADDFGSMRSSRDSPFSLGGESRRERGGFGMNLDHLVMFDNQRINTNRQAFKKKGEKHKRRYFNEDVLKL